MLTAHGQPDMQIKHRTTRVTTLNYILHQLSETFLLIDVLKYFMRDQMKKDSDGRTQKYCASILGVEGS